MAHDSGPGSHHTHTLTHRYTQLKHTPLHMHKTIIKPHFYAAIDKNSKRAQQPNKQKLTSEKSIITTKYIEKKRKMDIIIVKNNSVGWNLPL